MFGFSKDVQIKRELILYLDRQDDFVSSTELKNHIHVLTEQTILKYLREVRQVIVDSYPTNKLNLKIDTRSGVTLSREEINLNNLLEKIHREDLVYKIFQELILNRFFITEDFCKKYEVSFSTLRRIIRRINEFVTPYHVSVKAGLRVRILGEESEIRMLFFMFLFYVHRGIVDINWINADSYLNLAGKVYEAFNIEGKQHIDVFALWLFVNQCSDENNFYLEENIFEESFAVDFLENQFSVGSWNYILLIMYGLDLENFIPNTSFEIIHENQFFTGVKQWLVLFEKEICPLLPKDKESLYQIIYKNTLLMQVLPTLKDVYKVFGINNNILINETQVNFSRIFDELWQQFISSSSDFANEEMRTTFMIWSFQHIPLHQLLPTITIYWKNNLPTINTLQMGKILQYRLINDANIIFTNDEKEADLILSTENYDSAILVSQYLTKKDIQTVKNFIHEFIDK